MNSSKKIKQSRFDIKEHVTAVDQYRELHALGRHYDNRLILIPGAAFSLAAAITGGLYKFGELFSPSMRSILFITNALIFSIFIFQYVKERAFQLQNQREIKSLENLHSTGIVRSTAFTGPLGYDPKDSWFIKCTRQLSAANYAFYIMMFVQIALVILAVKSIIIA